MEKFLNEWQNFSENVLKEKRARIRFPNLDLDIKGRPEKQVANISGEISKERFKKVVVQATKRELENRGHSEEQARKKAQKYAPKLADKHGAYFTTSQKSFAKSDAGIGIPEHESFHLMFDKILKKYGKSFYRKVINKLGDQINDNIVKIISFYLKNYRSYEDFWEYELKEEVINWIYNILNHEDERMHFLRAAQEFIATGENRVVDTKKIIDVMKSNWKDVVKTAKNIEPPKEKGN